MPHTLPDTESCRSELAREKPKDAAFIQKPALALTSFASKLAPTLSNEAGSPGDDPKHSQTFT
ncbi:hypothetical protein GCM10008969_41130 [Pseudomonas veronii subsp. inensis]